MLTLHSGKKKQGFCDKVARREFLKIGALGIGGLTLADVFRAEAQAGISSSNKAVINIHLSGGPSHQDMFDLKPDAPVEFRGAFNPIHTNVPGFDICEHFPILATMADKFAVIRSLVGSTGQHSNYQTHSGFNQKDLSAVGGRPALGSVVAKLNGVAESGAPPFISYNGGEPGFLGPVYKPFKPDSQGQRNLMLQRGMTADRMSSRTSLLSQLDTIRRDIDYTGEMLAVDSFTEKAVEVVTSGEVGSALDLKKEDPKVVERYGKDGKNFLTARRLVEAGVRTVSFNWGSWDTHSGNFTKLSTQLPKLDIAMSALIQDLHDRGLDQDVAIVMWGEFGRSPRVNKNQGGGRDHWNKLSTAFLAGGGMRTGQAIGSSTRYAEQAQDRPIDYQEVHATLYRTLGIDSVSTTIADHNGRPQYLLDHRDPIRELI
ncbi:MAG: DUF1501 domain-containing protein [Pirellulales bacterium]